MSLRGTPRSSFEYTVTVGNDSGKDLTVALSAQGPANFQTTFTEGYGSNEISSIPIEAGQTKDIKVKVTPPRDVKAGDYPVVVRVAAEGATADHALELVPALWQGAGLRGQPLVWPQPGGIPEPAC